VSDSDKLDAAIRQALGLPDDGELSSTAYGWTEGWDSVGHMELMVGIESAFSISIGADDVFEMSDYAAVRRILRERYAIQLQDR